MRTLLIWGSLILWLNAAWAQTYPCGAFPSPEPSSMKLVQQNSSSLPQPGRNSSKMLTIIPTNMTEGAVHAYCNAVLWQYEGR